MNKGWNLARPETSSRNAFRDVLLVTVAVWAANWGILVTAFYLLGIASGWAEVFIRLVISAIGAASCMMIYKFLRHRQMSAFARLISAVGLMIPIALLVALLHEILFLEGTLYYSDRYGFGPADINILQCGTASTPCRQLLKEALATTVILFWVYVAWCAIYVGLTMAEELREREGRLHMAERAAQAAQLSALRFQLNPHFLFNTMNTLSGLIALDRKAQAEDIVLNLSSFLRFSLKSDEEELVTVSKEIEAQKMYLDIEQVRFADRLKIRYDVDEDCAQAAVPPLLLQPLVENAIKHAVSLADGIVRLTISAKRHGEVLVLTVQNSAWSECSEWRSESLGIGVNNIRNRLAALYGAEASLQAGPAADGGWVNVVSLPWMEQHEENAHIDCG
jgi:two-component system, LytTR family, sensor kinase